MQTQETSQTPVEQRQHRYRPMLVAAVAVAMIAIGLAILINTDDSSEPVSPAEGANPLPLVDQWVDAMNRGDLEAALAVLSPEASCDVPFATATIETCDQHLGYLVAIGTHFEERTCQETTPYRCRYGLTSEFHATLGYPDYSLPMSTEFSVDQDGLLAADFFGSIDPTTPYWPSDGGDLWGWMLSDYPELNLDPVFGPDPVDEAAGIAAMEAARRFNDPERIIEQLQGVVDVYATSGLRQCVTQHGTINCPWLMGFLEEINADVRLDCDSATAASGSITCPVTIDSDIHEALGSESSTSTVIIGFRGGVAQRIEMELVFATELAHHDAFMAYAANVDGLYENERPAWNADTAASWLDAAREFGGQ